MDGALEVSLDLPPALAVLPGGAAALADGAGVRLLGRREAQAQAVRGPVLVAHASLTGARLGLAAPPRSDGLYDALELWAFVRPARFCAPSAAGLAQALGWAEPRGVEAQATALRQACDALLAELADEPTPSREEALAIADTLARAGWPWAPHCIAALRSRPLADGGWRSGGLEVWTRLSEWEDEPPQGEPASRPVDGAAAAARLHELLARQGLDEARAAQSVYAAEAAYAFLPREREDEPRLLLAEAGTGVGKTLGYLAPASLWAESNAASVWVSTYTRALQRQIERESAAVFPDPAERQRKAVVRKGRENYLCLLNLADQVSHARMAAADMVSTALAARWARASRDGDLTGGDFPAWLPTLFALPPGAAAGPMSLADRRGECVHAACPHYRTCFVEKAIRGSRRAELVIANHALVLSQAAFDGARTRRDGETARLRRVVFDEGHHLFEAADSAFSTALSGQEAAELRRWVRGPEARGRRARGLEQRLGELVAGREAAFEALGQALRAAAALPAEGWSGRIAPGDGQPPSPSGPLERLLVAALAQLAARTDRRSAAGEGQECAARPAVDAVRAAAAEAAEALAALEAPLLTLARALEDVLDEEAADLQAGERARIEGALRGLERRARFTLPAWRGLLLALAQDAPEDPLFVDWIEAVQRQGHGGQGRVVDVAVRRHWTDPTEPLAEAVLKPAHGVLVTSATLTDPLSAGGEGGGGADPFALAEMRTGAARLPSAPQTLRLTSPFDYAAHSRCLVVTDVARDDPRQTAAALRELFLAAGGGGVGLFTAIRRLRAVHALLAPALGAEGLALYAQHVDPLEAGALVDIFRAEEDSCLLGTDAIRDGVDVPGRALRLLCFDRVPWPRPDLLHKARRARFGGAGARGRAYDDALARGRIAQAFGRLIRRADDRGVFVMLDAAAPTRLFSSLPEGVAVERLTLVEAIEAVEEFLAR